MLSEGLACRRSLGSGYLRRRHRHLWRCRADASRDELSAFAASSGGLSSRRLAVGTLSATALALGANFLGVTSALLSLAPERARALRLDTLYPLGGLRREFNATTGYEFLVPRDWLQDQTLARRRAQRLEQQLSRELPSLRTPPRRTVAEPDAAFGPAGSTGETNISVVVQPANAYGVTFRLANLGTPQEYADFLLNTVVAPSGGGKRATLLAATEQQYQGALAYELEFVVESEKGGWRRHFLSLLTGDEGGRLVTLTAQVPEAAWPQLEPRLRQCVASFRLLSP